MVQVNLLKPQQRYVSNVQRAHVRVCEEMTNNSAIHHIRLAIKVLYKIYVPLPDSCLTKEFMNVNYATNKFIISH